MVILFLFFQSLLGINTCNYKYNSIYHNNGEVRLETNLTQKEEVRTRCSLKTTRARNFSKYENN